MKSCFLVILLLISVAASAQDSTYKELVGKYKFPAGSVIEEAIVTLTSGVVSMSSAQGVSVLEKINGDTFNVVSFSGICIFKRNDTKKITGVHVDASGYVMDGVKDDAGYNNVSILVQAPVLPYQFKETDTITLSEEIAERLIMFRPKIIGCITR